jgi:glycosyltransferase involved in cell wall biosynthesis
MPRTYAAGDLLVLPSQGSGETWGLVVNEAMNLGKPIVVSSHVGCGPDLVRPGQNGWIFDAENVNQLADVLCKAASDRLRAAEYGRRSRLIVDDYSYQQTTAGLQQALNKICPLTDRSL